MTCAPRRWKPGDMVTWTYYTHAHPTITVRPGTCVLDDDRGIVLWIAPGTEVLLPVLDNGSPLRRAGDEGMFTAHRVQSKQLWTGNGILMIGLPDTPFSVWLFYKDDGSLGCYYINLETPYERTDEGIRSRDLVLDMVVLPRRDFHYKDEDELEGAQRTGYFTAEEVARIREYGRQAEKVVTGWKYPFNAGWEHFFPNPAWPIPQLPAHYTWDLDLTLKR
ncbi:DUF402 domain-containing protein [Devriesea agamarum]|uniref:DUF402 domain-containing protein n=1 Tax=Devriesea agamarum TaxID=472569 RepID=UPI00071E2292|nr:DUF402 domain-containing protein [Devriesea agamarum]